MPETLSFGHRASSRPAVLPVIPAEELAHTEVFEMALECPNWAAECCLSLVYPCAAWMSECCCLQQAGDESPKAFFVVVLSV